MSALMQNVPAWALATAAVAVVAVVFIGKLRVNQPRQPNSPPAVPGWPLIGNLLQLKEKRPYLTFVKWAEAYGPIYSIRLGASSMVVLNSTELAKEALVDKFSSISTRKLSNALTTLTCNKALVAMSDYGEYYKMVRRYVLSGLLGANAQRRNRHHRDAMIENVVQNLSSLVKDKDFNLVELRETFQFELFRLALKQSVGKDVESVYVEQLGVTMTKKEMIQALVIDPMMGAIEVDWRDFFPYLKWVPNKSTENKIHRIAMRKNAITKALIEEQRRRFACGEEVSCYLDYLLSEETTLTEEQLIALVWESLIEASDTTLATTEWAMYELSKNPTCQDLLYQELHRVCGSEKMTEEHIKCLPYLSAVFHETLRFHSPVPIIPPRHCHEDVQLGGYTIAAGTDIAINLYACNMDKKDWEAPEQWKPERFLSSNHEQMDMHKTMAFGGGKRVCAGSNLAMLISCTAIGRLIQQFHWKLMEGASDNIATVQLTTHMLRPMQAYIKPRSGGDLMPHSS